jgi:hypothetical protein
MPELSKNAELLEEITEMQAQLQRCKTIVSGILLSAGEARGESSVNDDQHLPQRPRGRIQAQQPPHPRFRV